MLYCFYICCKTFSLEDESEAGDDNDLQLVGMNFIFMLEIVCAYMICNGDSLTQDGSWACVNHCGFQINQLDECDSIQMIYCIFSN